MRRVAVLGGLLLGCNAGPATTDADPADPDPTLPAVSPLTLDQASAGAPGIDDEDLERLLDALEQELEATER